MHPHYTHKRRGCSRMMASNFEGRLCKKPAIYKAFCHFARAFAKVDK
jgi:hypothetical protein